MNFDRLKEINEVNADKALMDKRHQDLLKAVANNSSTVLSATTSLIKYLEGHTTKTQVVNQLKSIGTPDALKVVSAVNDLHKTLKTHENTDLTEITKVMQGILDEAKKIPKELPKPEKQQFVDYTNQFKALAEATKAVEKVVKEQKLIAEAPVINLPETQVNVEAPDLKPLQQGFKDVVGAVKKIVIPEYKTDNKNVEELIKKSNKLLKEIVDKPVSLGGGGGGSSWTAVNPSGIPMPLNLDANGNLKIAPNSVATTNTTATVAGSATVVTLIASNTSRKGATVYNDSSALLYLKLGAAASTSDFTAVIAPLTSSIGGYYEVPFGYTGIITGIWASATGNARVGELS